MKVFELLMLLSCWIQIGHVANNTEDEELAGPFGHKHICRSSVLQKTKRHEVLQPEHSVGSKRGNGPIGRYPKGHDSYPLYELKTDCTAYKYRPIRLLALDEPMRSAKFSPRANITTAAFERYKAVIGEVLREFQGIFLVPFDHVGDAGDITFDKMFGYYGEVGNDSTLNMNKVDLVIAVGYGDIGTVSVCNTTGGIVLSYGDAVMPYVVKLPRNDCDSMNKDRRFIPRQRGGMIRICPTADNRPNQMLKQVIRHELLHIMGFHSSACKVDVEQRMFRLRSAEYSAMSQGEATTMTPRFRWNTRYLMMFTGARVLETARRHYNCSDLQGMPFEDVEESYFFHPNSTESKLELHLRACDHLAFHWEEYHAGTELMTMNADPYSSISEMTVAFFEDVYLFKTNRVSIQKEMTEFVFGRNYGCEFIQKGCQSWMELNQQIRNKSARIQCSFPVVAKDVIEEYTPMSNITTKNFYCYIDQFCNQSCFYAFTCVHRIPRDAVDISGANYSQAPFRIRGYANHLINEQCPIWAQYTDQKTFGERPSWCPTTPAEDASDNVLTGCVQEGVKGPDYKRCPSSEWTSWTECVNCSLSIRSRNQTTCASYLPSNCDDVDTVETQTSACCNTTTVPPTTTTTPNKVPSSTSKSSSQNSSDGDSSHNSNTTDKGDSSTTSTVITTSSKASRSSKVSQTSSTRNGSADNSNSTTIKDTTTQHAADKTTTDEGDLTWVIVLLVISSALSLFIICVVVLVPKRKKADEPSSVESVQKSHSEGHVGSLRSDTSAGTPQRDNVGGE